MSFAIHRDPCYYAGALNASHPGLVTSHYDSLTITVATAVAADLLCKMLNDTGDGMYLLAHNQYARPNHETRESTLPVRHSLTGAMSHLDLQDCFDAAGNRIELTEF